MVVGEILTSENVSGCFTGKHINPKISADSAEGFQSRQVESVTGSDESWDFNWPVLVLASTSKALFVNATGIHK
jgi:hypothetical protein